VWVSWWRFNSAGLENLLLHSLHAYSRFAEFVDKACLVAGLLPEARPANTTDHTHCVRGKKQNVFWNISYKNWEDSDKIWYTVIWINLIQKSYTINIFHLNWIMSLHYVVKRQMLIVHVLPLNCYRKKLQNLFHLNCGLQIPQIWIQSITMCGDYCKRRCMRHT